MKLDNIDNIYLNNNQVDSVYLNGNRVYPVSVFLSTNLVLHLDAGNTSSYSGTGTTWTDLTGNGYNGTLVNSPSYSSTDGGSIDLTDSSDHIRIGTVPYTGTSTQSVTWELWVNPSDNDGNIMSMSSNNPQGSWNMPPIAASGGKFRGKIWANNYLYSQSSFTQGNWYQVALVWDYGAGTQRLYVNGVLQSSQSGISYSASGANNYLFLGQQNPGADNKGNFAGKYSIVRVYSKALTTAEVLNNFDSNKNRYGL